MNGLDLSIPAIDELAALGERFVGWRWETRNGKATKPPIAATGGYASATDGATWCDIGRAQAAVQRQQLDGLGFVLDAARDGIVGIDLDACRDGATGVIAPWADKIVRSIGSYTEVSPSGGGLKILCRAAPVPELAANKRTIGKANGTKAAAVEVYTSGRYFCLTGQALDHVPDEIVDATPALERLAAWIARAKPNATAEQLPQAFAALLERDAALRAAWGTGAKIGQGGDASASGLDWSLACHLRPLLDDADLKAALRAYPHGQIGSGRLRGAAADRRVKRILDEVGPRPTASVRTPPPLRSRTMSALAGQPVPPQRFLHGDWIPAGKPTLLAGHGGGGKTTLVCQFAASRAIGLPFLEMAVDQGRTLALLAEEDADDAHRMLARLANYLARDLAEFSEFTYLPRAGEDNVLVARTAKGEVVATPLYQGMAEMIGDLKPSCLVLDNARHVCRIEENNGADVTAAWNLLHGLMRPHGGATILCGHTPKNGSAEFSGNAAWENVARCRIFLGPAAPADGEQPIENDPRRVLRRGKSNAGGTASRDILWERGAFRLERPGAGTYGDHLDREMRRGQARQAFLDALQQLTVQRRHVSHAPSAQNFAPKQMLAAGMGQGFGAKELASAMNELFAEGRILAQQPLWPGPDRHPVKGIAPRGAEQ